MASNKKKYEIEEPIEDIEISMDEMAESNTSFIEKTMICPARYSDGFIFIEFQGFGVMLPNSDNHTEPEIKVYYQGNIGTTDFKIRV